VLVADKGHDEELGTWRVGGGWGHGAHSSSPWALTTMKGERTPGTAPHFFGADVDGEIGDAGDAILEAVERAAAEEAVEAGPSG